MGWGGTDIEDPLAIIETHRSQDGLAGAAAADGVHHRRARRVVRARRGVAPAAGADAAPRSPTRWRASARIASRRCAPCCSWPVPAARLRAGATGKSRAADPRRCRPGATRVTSGGAPVYVWPGGGITYMVDVARHAGEWRSAVCRRPRWWRRSSLPCRSPTTPAWRPRRAGAARGRRNGTGETARGAAAGGRSIRNGGDRAALSADARPRYLPAWVTVWRLWL